MIGAGIHHIIFGRGRRIEKPWNEIFRNAEQHTNCHEGGGHATLGRLTARQWGIYYLNGLLGTPDYYLGWLRSHGELLVRQIAKWEADEILR